MNLLGTTVTPFLRLILAVAAAGMIFAGLAIYLRVQRVVESRARSLETAFDRSIPYRPRWVWVYTSVYYLMLLGIVGTVRTLLQFAFAVTSYLFLLLVQMVAFASVPAATPAAWRRGGPPGGISERLLHFIQTIDGRSNCFPSMHVSMAVLTVMLVHRHTGFPLAWLAVYPLLVALSSVFTKQHSVVDVLVALPFGLLPYIWLVQLTG